MKLVCHHYKKEKRKS